MGSHRVIDCDAVLQQSEFESLYVSGLVGKVAHTQQFDQWFVVCFYQSKIVLLIFSRMGSKVF